MGIEGVELLSNWQNSGSDGVPRESAQEEHDRKEAEQNEARVARQIRLGHIPNPDEESPETE
jgi:hypothetical protein